MSNWYKHKRQPKTRVPSADTVAYVIAAVLFFAFVLRFGVWT